MSSVKGFLSIHTGDTYHDTLLRFKQKHGKRSRKINPLAVRTLLNFTIQLSRLKVEPFLNILIYL